MSAATAPGDRARQGAWLVGLAAFALYAALTHDRVFMAGNDAARFAHVEARVDLGRPNIDGSRYDWTYDRVTIDGRDYANKPPLLGLAGAAAYGALARPLGLSFERAEARTLRVLTVVLVGLTSAWLVARFHLALGLYGDLDPGLRLATTACLALGSLLLSFSGTFNNHTVAAALLFAAFHASLLGRGLRAGAFAGLSICVDIVPGVVLLPVLARILWGRAGRFGLLRFAAALGAAALVFVAANWVTVGHPLPPKMVPGGHDHSSQFAGSLAGVLLPATWTYPLECLIGWHGLFLVSPVLLLGVAGLARAARAGEPIGRAEARWLAVAIAVIVLGHALAVGSFGGWSFGFRYLIPVAPLLLFFVPASPLGRRRLVLMPLLVVSTLFALLGAYHPWPPAYEQEGAGNPVAAVVTNPIGGNLAGWAREHVPGTWLARWSAERFISRDARERDLYLMLFFASKGDQEMEQTVREEASRPRRR